MKAINLLNEVNKVDKLYVYQKIAELNGNILSVVNVENRTLDFHVHENSDETEDSLTRVNAGEFVIVPKGVKHRPVVKELTKFMMIEFAGTLNKENSGELYEDPQ